MVNKMKYYAFSMSSLFAFVLFSFTFLNAAGPIVELKIDEKDVPQYLEDVSVTIRSTNSEGSGVLRTTKDGQVWVWTCGHVIQSLRNERTTADKKTIVEFNDAKVVKIIAEDGRKVAEMNFDAEVIRYSDSEYGEDLALLRLRTKKFKPSASTLFYLDDKIPSIGSKLMHCGSLLGTLGSNSVTTGIVSQQGRILSGIVYDQTNCATFPGSSGGIICLEKDGRYIGMLVRGSGETFGLYVPIRRMHKWAKKVGVEFTLTDTLPVPAEDVLRNRQIDDSLWSKEPRPMRDGKKLWPTKERKVNILNLEMPLMPSKQETEDEDYNYS